jgi:hypothetical protein
VSIHAAAAMHSLEEIATFVQGRIHDCRPFEGDIAAVPITRHGILIAGIVWHSYDARAKNIEGAIASSSPYWASRRVLRFAFEIPFKALGCRRVTARCNASNTKSRRLLERLGFQLEGLLRQAAHDGGDVLIYGLLKEECRFL